MPPILYLLDGHALAYRTYYALTGSASSDSLRSSTGEPTAGVFGFTSALLRLLEKEKPQYLAVAFDTGKTFRDELFKEYKATRAKMPDDLQIQMERIKQVVDVFGFPRLEMEGFEADDILGSIAHQAVEKGFGVKIITGDRDLLQLVDERIIVNLPGRSLSDAKDYDAEKVNEYMGVSPKQIIDYKALAGDSSDNIPGVRGVGQKTATSLLQKFQTLDGVYEHLDEISKSVRNKLETSRENAYLSYQLAAIRTDVHISLDLDKALVDFSDLNTIEELFSELSFKSLMNRLVTLTRKPSGGIANDNQLPLFSEEITHIGQHPQYQPTVHIVDTPESLAGMLKTLQKSPLIAFDTETSSTDAHVAELVGISLAVKGGEGYYIPVGHKTGENQLSLAEVIDALRPVMTDEKIAKSGHNLKYDVLVLGHHGLDVKPLSFDTMIAGWLVDPSSHRLGLKDMAESYLDISMTYIEELIGKGKSQISMANVPVEKAAPYAVADAEVTYQLQQVLQKQLTDHHAEKLFHEMEMPLIPVLIEMENNGIALDTDFFKQMAIQLSQRLHEIEKQVYQMAGAPFNLNSTQQLSKVLFQNLQLEPPRGSKRTSSGHISTSADVLEEMRGQHPVVDFVLEYRELSKLKSTYVDSLPLQVNEKTGRIHTSFNQTGSVTGRLASSDPNLQNIPTRTEMGRKVRHGFVAAPGMMLVAVDYSQIELRIVAHMSNDESMLAAFKANQDIHSATAAAIYGMPIGAITKEQRRHAKAINFGLIYGMSAFGLSRSADLTLNEAEIFVNAYFEQFPNVKSYLDELKKQAASQGFVETMLGRRRYFPNLRRQTNANIKNREEREAINAPIQGTAADIIKIAMIRLPDVLRKAKMDVRLLLQVHDELVLECPLDQLSDTVRVVKDTMENAFELSIPLTTEARTGKNWGELEPVD